MRTDPFPNLLFPSCAECAGIGYRHVPPLLWDMEDDQGADVMKAFVLEYGGQTIKVSEAFQNGFQNALHFGTKADPLTLARWWLYQNRGSGEIAVPLGPAARAARVAWTAYHMLKDGASLSQVADRTALDLRSVCNIKNKLRKIGALPQKGSQP